MLSPVDPESHIDVEALSSSRVGRVLAGKWHLVHLLGAGSAGAVYMAVGPGDEAAAVKVLHPELAAEPTVRARFVREAYVANKIGHAGVVRVIEDGVDEGLPYLVMELLEGETLEARLARKGGRLPIDEVLWAADRTLQVLAAAHDKGIVHRDIKPENLFLTRDRRLKVLDFGIARLGESREQTTVGTILGTLAFMPPEQARGDVAAIGVRSDLWSVGATMFNLLSGRLVRDDEDIAKLLREAGQAKVQSLAGVAPGLPRDLIDLVDYALSLEAEARWPTAKTMRRAVRMVHAKIKHDSARAASKEDDDDEVSAPSFGVIATREIDPPPLSVAYNTEQKIKLAVAAGDPSAKDVAIPSVKSDAASTLQSARDSAVPDTAPARNRAPAAEPEPPPVPTLPSVPSVPSRPRPSAPASGSRSLPVWAIAMAIAIVAAVALFVALR
jgi:serine/threonine-protein kinase